MKTSAAATVVKSPDKEERILDAATKVFAEQGFENAETQTIADLAQVGKGTVYRYHGSKEGLFLAVANSGMKKLERCVFDAIEDVDGTFELIRCVGLAYGTFFQEHPELVEILIQERAAFRGSIPDTHLVYRQKNLRVLEEILHRGIEQGEIRRINVRETTNTFANVLYGTVVCGCIEGSSKRLKCMAEHAVDVFLWGIATDTGRLLLSGHGGEIRQL